MKSYPGNVNPQFILYSTAILRTNLFLIKHSEGLSHNGYSLVFYSVVVHKVRDGALNLVQFVISKG